MLANKYLKISTRSLVGVSAIALLATTGIAHAQETTGTDLEEIVITGTYAGSVQAALDIKRNADSIVDAVSASDIGKFPAVNIAEALQRVPGVTITREAGEGQFVSVRGLGPIFQSVSFNGSPIAFNENIRNSGQSGRQFRFRVIPSDLIAGVTVAKAPTADLMDGGIGSNINVKTFRALDLDPFISARAFGHYEDRSGKFTPNAAVSSSWKNEDDTFGIVGGISFQQREVQFDRIQIEGWNDRTVEGQAVRAPNDIRATLEREDRTRLSFFGGAQFRPSDTAEFNLDAMYSTFNNKIDEDRILYEFGSRLEGEIAPGSSTVQNGVVTAATIDGGRINRNSEISEQTHENLFIKFSADFDLAEWRVSPSISYSIANSDLDIPLQRIDARTTDSTGLSYAYDIGGAIDNASLNALTTNLDLTDPNAVPFRRFRIRPINSEDKDVTAMLDFERDLDASVFGITLSSIKFGGQYSDRSRNYQRRDRTLAANDGVTVDGSFYDQFVPTNAFDGNVNSGAINWARTNFDQFFNSFTVPGEFSGVNPQASDLTPTDSDLRNSYGVDEEITAAYGRIDFNSDVSGIPVYGNVGLRWVQTKTAVTGTILTAGDDGAGGTTTVTEPFVFNGKYDKFLPSLNLTFEISDTSLLRLGLSRSLTRPSLADLRSALVPNSTLVSDVFERGQDGLDNPSPEADFVGVGGNPQLSPYSATNVDVSFEWYFEEFGAFTVAAFYKDIQDFIGSIARPEQIALSVSDGSTVVTTLDITRPNNIGEAKVAGIEFGYANKLDSGFGLAASLTITESSGDIETPGGTISAPLQGVSDLSYTISPFYELNGLEVHLSYTWRSKFSRGFTVAPDNAAAFFVDSFGTLDFGAEYDLDDTFTIFAEGVNLTNNLDRAFEGSPIQPREISNYGRSFNIGVRARF